MKQKFWWLGNSLKQYIEFPLLFMEGGHGRISEGSTASSDGQFRAYEIFHGLREHHVCPGWVKKLAWARICGFWLKHFLSLQFGAVGAPNISWRKILGLKLMFINTCLRRWTCKVNLPHISILGALYSAIFYRLRRSEQLAQSPPDSIKW